MDILKILSEYGLAGFVLFAVLTVVFRLLAKEYKGSLGKLASSLSSDDEVVTDLRYHPFFSGAHYKVVAEIPTLELAPNKPAKQQLFRDILTIYIKTMINSCNQIVAEDMSDWTGEKWANEVSKHMNRLVTDFHKDCLDHGVPNEAVTKFLKWHYPTLEMLYDYITKLGTSNIYNTNLLRTSTFLFVMNLLLVTTLGDAERSLKELNGEVGGKPYKNMTLEH
jgi:hypothetical protein